MYPTRVSTTKITSYSDNDFVCNADILIQPVQTYPDPDPVSSNVVKIKNNSNYEATVCVTNYYYSHNGGGVNTSQQPSSFLIGGHITQNILSYTNMDGVNKSFAPGDYYVCYTFLDSGYTSGYKYTQFTLQTPTSSYTINLID